MDHDITRLVGNVRERLQISIQNRLQVDRSKDERRVYLERENGLSDLGRITQLDHPENAQRRFRYQKHAEWLQKHKA